MSKTVEEAFHAFMDQWRSRPTAGAYIFPPSSEDVFAAGAAYGRAEEREAVLQEIADTHRSRAWSEWNDALDEAEARIRQRGEK